MKTYQVEVTVKDTKNVVKRFSFQTDEQTAYDIFNEWAGRYDSSHRLELSDKRTGRLLIEGRQSGFAEFE